MKTINISKDFSRYPGLRYKRLGEYSGEEFRDNLLIPALEQNSVVSIELDDTRGYGSSFLEEAFGGAVRKGHNLNTQKLHLVSEDNDLKNEIWDYIKNASRS